MILNLRPKCANPSCAASFEWLAGGRLFRVRRESSEVVSAAAEASYMSDSSALGHYWLCERCSSVYTLQFEPGTGVKIVPLRPELPAAKRDMPLPAR